MTNCVIWQKTLNGNGYGLRFTGKTKANRSGQELAHRVAYRESYGDFDSNLKVLHRCDNPSCVNPEHLFLGTQADNIRDMIAKNRQNFLKRERHGRAKLDWEKVKAVRDRWENGETAANIAKDYRISRGTVCDIKNHRTWKCSP